GRVCRRRARVDARASHLNFQTRGSSLSRYGARVLRAAGAVFVAALALLASAPAQASSGAQYGIQDDAWLMFGPGTLTERVTTLRNLGAGLVRFTLRWDKVSPSKPASARD